MKSAHSLLSFVASENCKSDVPTFQVGDTVAVHVKISEGNKERIQVFEGTVLKRSKKNSPDATFTVRKVSYNVGVERTFLLHSPRVDKIEVVQKGKVRRARLFYLRPLRGKAAKIKTLYTDNSNSTETTSAATATDSAGAAA